MGHCDGVLAVCAVVLFLSFTRRAFPVSHRAIWTSQRRDYGSWAQGYAFAVLAVLSFGMLVVVVASWYYHID